MRKHCHPLEWTAKVDKIYTDLLMKGSIRNKSRPGPDRVGSFSVRRPRRTPRVTDPGRSISSSWPAATAFLLMPSPLTDAQVSVDGGIAGSASQVLVFPVGDMLVGAGITVFLGQAEVNDVDQVAFLPQAHEEVVRLHVPVDEVLGVDVLDAADLGEVETAVTPHRVAILHKAPCSGPGERSSLSMKCGFKGWPGLPKL